MSKENNFQNAFAALKGKQFPDKKDKEQKNNKVTHKTFINEKKKKEPIVFDEDQHLFLASIGEVNKLSNNKKIHEDHIDNSYTMAELLAENQKTKIKEKNIEKKVSKKIVVETKQEDDQDADEAFFKAVADVKSLDGKGRAVNPCPKEVNLTPPPVSNPLQDFMDGKLEFALNATEEYVEGHILGIDLLTVGKLQNRQYSPEAHIDLHGLNAEQAYHNLIAFFRNSYQRGLRTVLVVTGKGKNSINGMPVLRTKVQEWFTKEPFRRVVIAFCTAKQEDGGSGALYVLIRKQKKTNGKVYWDLTPTDSDFFL